MKPNSRRRAEIALLRGPIGSASSALVLALGLLSARPGASVAREFPAAALGDIWFTVDHAGFLEGDDLIEEYYIQVPNDRLDYRELPEGGLEGTARVTLSFRNDEDKEVSKVEREFVFRVRSQGEAKDAEAVQLFLIKEPYDPRAREVRVTVEDMNARKRGLLYLVTGRRKDGVATARVHPPAFRPRGLNVSDLQFAWEVTRAHEGSMFQKSGYSVTPNPSRAYGLLKPRMTAYFEIYDARSGASSGSRRFEVRSEVTGAAGEKVSASADTADYEGASWAKIVSFDLENQPSGVYNLSVEIRDLATGDRVIQSRKFSMIWSEKSWMSAESEVVDEARVLLAENDFRVFLEMPSGDRENYLARFWADHDPSPMTARNELREEFEKRVRFTTTHFTSSYERGMLSDRGRIYIRYGEPDEIRKELMPNRDENLETAL